MNMMPINQFEIKWQMMSFNQFDWFYVGCKVVSLFDLLNISSSSGPFHSGGWAEEHVKETGKMIAELEIFEMMHIRRRVMLEEGTLRKMKGLLATSNRLPPWSSVVNQYSQEQVKSGYLVSQCRVSGF